MQRLHIFFTAILLHNYFERLIHQDKDTEYKAYSDNYRLLLCSPRQSI